MAASVNNLASAFSTLRIAAPPPPPFSTSPASTTALFPSSVTSGGLSISASWNPHSTLPRHRFSSLLSLYGPPGPPPSTTVLRCSRGSVISIGHNLPSSTLSYLSGNNVLTTSSAELARGRKIVVLGIPAAFAPWGKLSAEELVRGAGEMKRRGAAAVACVAVNDVFVMRAWGESIGAFKEGVVMLSDGDAGMARALGVAADFAGGAEGFGVRSENYCLVAADGVVRALFREEDGAGFEDVIRAI